MLFAFFALIITLPQSASAISNCEILAAHVSNVRELEMGAGVKGTAKDAERIAERSFYPRSLKETKKSFPGVYEWTAATIVISWDQELDYIEFIKWFHKKCVLAQLNF